MKHPGAKLAAGKKPKKSAGKVAKKNGVKKISKKKVASNHEPTPVASPLKRTEQHFDIEMKDEDDVKPEEAHETRVAKPVKDGTKRAAKGGITKRREKKPAKPSTKEQLVQMNRQERKAFLRSLKEKKPNFPVAQQAKILWEKIRRLEITPLYLARITNDRMH
jgi:hypothetical protein